jgi:hypothetical protein
LNAGIALRKEGGNRLLGRWRLLEAHGLGRDLPRPRADAPWFQSSGCRCSFRRVPL